MIRISLSEGGEHVPTRVEHLTLRRILALSGITAWMVWAYLRLRPAQALFHHGLFLGRPYNGWAYQHLAYSDIVALFVSRHLYLHQFPYIHNLIEYPVLTGLFMWGTSLVHGFGAYFFLSFVVLYLIAVGIYFLLEKVVPRQAVFFGVMPLLLAYGLLNWDLLGILFMVLGFYCYQRGRGVWSAIWFACGVFAKLFPIFFLPFILMDLARHRDWQRMRRMVTTFVIASLVINLPFALGNFKNWVYFFTFNAGRGVGGDIFSNAWVHGVSISTANIISLGFTVVVVALMMWRVYHGARVQDAAAYAFTAFLLVNKIYSPQYTLWLMVYALMAEWPVWAFLVLTFTGLVDYVNSFTEMHLITVHARVLGWYTNHGFSLGLLLRYVALVVSSVGTGVTRAVGVERPSHVSLPRSRTGGVPR